MTARVIAPVKVRRVHCVLLATYRNEPVPLAALDRWRHERAAGPPAGIEGLAVEETDLRVARHDFASYSLQAILPGTPADDEAGRLCRAYLDARPLPEGGLLGTTTLVLARVEGAGRDRLARAEAAAILGGLSGHVPRAVSGGKLGEGVELWADQDDLDRLILLCDDDDRAEDDAGQVLYVGLRMMEAAFHKILHQARQAGLEWSDVSDRHEELSRELRALTASLDRLDDDEEPDALRSAERQGGRTLRAECRLIGAVGRLRDMKTSIEANRSNVLAYRTSLGDGAGLAALDARVLRIGQELDQIRANIAYCRPILETTRVTGESHQTRLMTVLSLGEIHENRLREGITGRLALLGLAIGLLQIATAVLPILLPRPADELLERLWPAFWAVATVSVVLFGVALWPRKPPGQPTRGRRP